MKLNYVYATAGMGDIKRYEKILDIGENEVLLKGDDNRHIVLNKNELIHKDKFDIQQKNIREEIEYSIKSLLYKISTKGVYDYTLKDLKKTIDKIVKENKDLLFTTTEKD